MIFDIKNRSKELGHSNYFKIIEKHNNSFVVIEDKLRDFFKEYKNRNKIITLLGIWLYFIRALYESYGEKGLQSFLDSDYDCVNRFAYKYEYGLSINNKIKNIKRTKPFIFLDLFLEKPLLPGGIVTSLIHKLKWRFTHLIIAFTPIKSSSKRKNELNLYISEYFNDLSIDKENYKNISELIPQLFYADYINTFNSRDLQVECSPWAFLDFSGAHKMLLIQRKVLINGFQHGGGYFSYQFEIGEYFEKLITDTFIGWGLSPELNRRQHKYPKRNTDYKSIKKTRRLIWIERGFASKYASFLWPFRTDALRNEETIEYISSELIKSKIMYYNLPHPGVFRCVQYDKVRDKEIKNVTKGGENIINYEDVVIFDVVISTLIHYCVEAEILFILVVPREDVLAFTDQQKEWFELMRNSNLAFYNDEVGSLSSRIIKIMNDNIKIPSQLRNYHNEKFII